MSLTLLCLSLAACGGGGGGGGNTRPTSDGGVHEPAPSSATEGDAVLVGVADSGFRLTHEALSPHVEGSANLVEADSDDVGGDADHGTAVASLVADGESEPALYLAKVGDPDNPGMAWNNVLDYSVGYLADQGARVINHSWSGRTTAPSSNASYRGVRSLDSLRRVVTANDGLGSVYVVAAGNDGQPITSDNPIHRYPEIYARMLVVGGTAGDGEPASWSNHPGDNVDWQSRFLAAPGTRKVATAEGDDTYATWQGTSIAAPQVAAFAAAMIARWPHLAATEVADHLLETADRSSPLYDDHSCGESGETNCGDYYLGQGEADLPAALEPAGGLAVPSGARVDGPADSPQQSVARLSGAYGDGLARSGALADVAAFDALGRDYPIDLSPRGAYREPHADRMAERMARLSTTSPRQRQRLDAPLGPLRFASTVDGQGELVASRLDARVGRFVGTAFRHDGDEVAPLSGYAESGIMPLLSFQGGSALTRTLGSVTGLRTDYALDAHLALTARHWRGDGEADAAAPLDGYRASRSDIGLTLDVTSRLALTTTLGVLEEEGGLLGGQGTGALSLGEHNRTAVARLALDARLGRRWRAFADYEQGRGKARGDGLIQRLDGIRTGALGMGLQRSSGPHRVALAYRRPLRIDAGTAHLSVPVGRTVDGEVVRESRTASLSPSGREQDVELGYRYRLGERGSLGFNLSHTRQPGHEKDAAPDTAAVAGFRMAW